MKDLWRFLKFYKPYAGWAWFGIGLSVLTAMSNIALMAVSGWFIAVMGVAGVTGIAINYFTPAAIIRGLAIVRTGGRYAERLVTHDATLRMTAGFRQWFYDHLDPLAPAALHEVHSGDLLQRMRGDIDTLEKFYLNAIVPLCVAALSLPLIALTLFFYSPLLAVIEFSLLFGVGLIIPLFLHHFGREDQDVISQNTARLAMSGAEAFQGLSELLVYGQVDQRIAHLKSVSDRIIHHQISLSRMDSLAQGIVILCIASAVVGSMLIGIPLVRRGILPPEFLAVIPLFSLICFDLVIPLPSALQSLQAAKQAARRIFEITDRTPPVQFSGIEMMPSENGEFVLSLEAVSFRYAQDSPWVLQDRSLSLTAGQVLTISGPSGSGKSTIVNLVTGLWPIQFGDITISGQSIRNCDPFTWRNHFSVAEQRPYIFTGSIRQNLMLANPDASSLALDQACRVVGLYEEIIAFPNGYDTFLGENGARLSGGQIRRLAIARALLKTSSCLILDEPLEGLDREQGKAILDNVLEQARQKRQAVLIISH